MKIGKILSRNTSVDESLFGEPNRIKQRNKMLDDKWQKNNNNNSKDECIPVVVKNACEEEKPKRKPVHSNDEQVFCPEDVEIVRIVGQDLYRHLRVPKEKVKEKSLLLNPSEYHRLKAKSKVLTDKELEEIELNEKKLNEQQMFASKERRNFMKNMDMKRRRNEKLSDLEEDAYRKAQYLLEKAMRQREEMEPEIKLMNNLAKNAQIQNIRDNQVMEKQQISRELKEEDARLDNIMEIDRINQIRIQEEIDKKRMEEEKLGAMHVLKQIESNQEAKLIELEMKDRENQEYRKQFIEQMEEEHQKRIKEETSKHKLRKELDKANFEQLARKHCERERDIMLTQRVLAIQREKDAKLEAYETEQKRIKKEKEYETARLRALQEKFADEKAERDALAEKRARDDKEREWRRKEEEAIVKKITTEEMLMKAREEQLKDRERMVALQATRDRDDFNRMLKAQKEAIEKEKEEIERRFGHRQKYRDDLTEQIREKERQLIVDRHEYFLESVRMQEEANLRKQRLNKAKERKMSELKKAGLPDLYLAQLDRKLKAMAEKIVH